MPDGSIHPALAAEPTTISKPSRRRRQACTTALTAAAGSDAPLLDLGRRFDAAFIAERTTWNALPEHDDSSPAWEHASDLSEAVGSIVDEIERTRATTFPGLLVKARALRWSRGTGTPITISYFDLRPLLGHFTPSGEERMMVSLLTDLHDLAAEAAQ